MLEPEIAAFVARANAFYPDNTASLPTVEQRALVQIGSFDEISDMSRIPYQAERTEFQTAGAAVSLSRKLVSENCPLRMRCINSMPASVIAALLKRLKPSMTLVRNLM